MRLHEISPPITAKINTTRRFKPGHVVCATRKGFVEPFTLKKARPRFVQQRRKAVRTAKQRIPFGRALSNSHADGTVFVSLI